MSNELVIKQPKTELAPVGLSDPLAAYADAVSPQYIIGDLLRFSKGDYYAGLSDASVAIGANFTVAVDELMAGWIKWWDSKPVEHIMVRVDDGKPLPKRNDLGDDDQSAWETDVHGKPRDPWQFVNYLPMMNDDGKLFTFTTSSRGGINTIARLAKRYAAHRKRHPDVYPIISLGVGSYQHPNKEFGRIKFPEFVPAGYEPKTKFLTALETAGIATPEDGSAPPIQPEPSDEFSDAVPF